MFFLVSLQQICYIEFHFNNTFYAIIYVFVVVSFFLRDELLCHLRLFFILISRSEMFLWNPWGGFLSHPLCLHISSFHLSAPQQRRTLPAIFYRSNVCHWYNNLSKRLFICFHVIFFQFSIAGCCSNTAGKVEKLTQKLKYWHIW